MIIIIMMNKEIYIGSTQQYLSLLFKENEPAFYHHHHHHQEVGWKMDENRESFENGCGI